MGMFHLLKIRTSIDIFKNEKCKCTFGLEYRYIYHVTLQKLEVIKITTTVQVFTSYNPI